MMHFLNNNHFLNYRELGFFFPDFVAPTVAGKRKKRKLQRTLALIRPHALQERKGKLFEVVKKTDLYFLCVSVKMVSAELTSVKT